MRICKPVRAALLVLVLALAGATVARAQDEGSGASFVSPFPKGDIYRVQVIGDDLAEGLLYGMTEAFAGDAKVEVLKKNISINGLMRPDFEDRLSDLQSGLAPDPAEIAVVMVGAWDRTPGKNAAGKRLQVGTAEWRAEYAARADRLIKALKQSNMAVYWVGLPNVRRPDFDEDAKMMNEILRERIYLNSLKYVDAYAGFADEQGGYSAYGPDLTGKMRLLREGDGVYFTAAGNRKLAHFVEKEIRRDVTQAKTERNVPLAGSEAEQAKIRPVNAAVAPKDPNAPAPASPQTPAQTKAPGTAAAPGWSPVTTPAASAEQIPVEQKADNGKISLKLISQTGAEEVVTLDIVRPAIPASVVALVTRRESPDKPSQMGHSLVDQVSGGLTMMSSITPSAALGNGRGLSPTQSPYYRVLMKGERLTPKKGRADDFTWPRAEVPISQFIKPPEPQKADASIRSAPSSSTAETGTLRPPPARN
jgi:hypothetical protein